MVRTSGKLDTRATLAKVGEAVRLRRSGSGLSQEALADCAKIDRSHMGKIERGERNVSLLLVERIATALDVTIAELMADAKV